MDFDLTVIRTIDASDRTMLNPRMLNSGMLPIVIEVSKPEVQDLTVEKSAAETMMELLHNPTPMQGKLHTDPTIEEKKIETITKSDDNDICIKVRIVQACAVTDENIGSYSL